MNSDLRETLTHSLDVLFSELIQPIDMQSFPKLMKEKVI